MPDPILVCFAVPQEAAPFRKRLGDDLPVEILVTGMGEKNTREALTRLWNPSPSRPWKAVITSGFAGGLRSRWNRGDVLVWSPHAFLTQAFESAGAHAGRFLASDRILIRPEEKEAAEKRSDCDAVEMESSVVHELCSQRGIPAATVRVISDARGDSLPLDFNALLNERSELPLGRILGAIVRKPSAIPGLMRLGKHSARAAEAMAEVLCRGLGRLK